MLYIILILLLAYPLYIWDKQNKGALGFWFLIPAAISAITGVYQAIKGAKERREAKAAQRAAMAQQEQLVAEANQRAMNGLPQEQYQKALQDIQRNQGYAIQQLRDRRTGVAGVGAVQQRSNDAVLGLDVQDAAARERNQRLADAQYGKLISMRGGYAQQSLDYGGALQAAGIQNIGNAVSSISQMGGAGAFSGGSGVSGGNGFGSINSVTGGVSSYGNGYDTSLTRPLPRISYKYNKI